MNETGLRQCRKNRADPDRLFRESRHESPANPCARLNARRGAARKSSAPRNCSARSISARAKTTKISSWPKPSPAPAPTLSADSRKNTRWWSSPRCLRNAPPAFITIPPPSLTPTVRCWASIARCTFPTTRCTTKNFISRPAISASGRGRPDTAKIGVLICWDQWYPEAARLTALQGAQILFYPDRHRLASRREEKVRRTPARRLGNHPAQPCRRQRLLCCRGQPHRPRTAGRPGH